jgi:hypothetical protein
MFAYFLLTILPNVPETSLYTPMRPRWEVLFVTQHRLDGPVGRVTREKCCVVKAR